MGGEIIIHMLLPHITKTQQRILLLLYRFRFLDRIQIQTFLHNPDIKNTNTWLKDLYDKNYIGKIVDSNSKINMTPAIYFIGKNGIKFLRAQDKCEKKYLKKLYDEKGKSKQFVERSLLVANTYLNLLQKYSNSKLTFYTQSDFSLNGLIRDIMPNFVFRIGKNKQFTICEILKENMPRFAIRSRVQQYLEFLTEGEWAESEKSPVLIFACPNEVMKKYIQRFIKREIEEMNIERINCHVGTYSSLQNWQFEKSEFFRRKN